MALIIHNRSFSKKLHKYQLDAVINYAISSNKIDDYFLIVPTGRLSRHLKYDIINSYFNLNNKPCGSPEIFNLNKFAEYCFFRINPNSNYKLISPPYRLSLIEDAMHNADLSFYKLAEKNLSYSVIERISNIVYGLREDGISSAKMLMELSNENPEQLGIKDKNKFSDIAKILIEYEKLLAQRYLDHPALLDKLNEQALNHYNVNNGESSIFDKLLLSQSSKKQIFLYGFSEFKTPEVAFLSHFAKSSIPLCIHLEFSEINGPLFGNLDEMKSTLLSAGYDYFYTDDEYLMKDANPENELNSSAKDFLRRWLFNVERDIKYNGLNDIVNVYEFESTTAEITQISKLIKYLISKEGYSPYDIAVVSRNIGSYSQLLRSSFRLEKIPANFSDRFSLAESQVVISIISVLDTVAGSFKINDVFKTLESRFIEIYNESGELLDKSNLLQSARELRLTASNISLGKEFWLKRLSGIVEYLEGIKQEIDSKSGSKLDKSMIDAKIRSYNKAYLDFYAFSESLPVIPNRCTPDNFRKIIIDGIIKKFKIADTIKAMYDEAIYKYEDKFSYEYERAIENVEKFSRSLGEFVRIVDEMTFILNDNGKKNLQISDLINKLKVSISGAKYQTREKKNYGVTVTSIEQIRHIPFKITILCGLSDGAFPLPYKPESFLGKELKDSEQKHLQSEQIHFYQLLINGADFMKDKSKRIYLTYTNMDGKLEVTRSSFVDSFLKVTNLAEHNKVVNFKSDNNLINYQDYPWFDSVSNRLESAELFAYEIANSIQLSDKLFGSEYNSETLSELSIIKKYANNYFQRFNMLKSGSFIFESNESKNQLKRAFDNKYSATDFENYASCSYKYFAKKVLRLKEQADEQILFTALEFGNIMHSALYHLYIDLQNKTDENWVLPKVNSSLNLPKLQPVNITKFNDRMIKMLFNEKIENEFKDIRLDHPVVRAVKREILGDDEHIGLAEEFIDAEYKRAATLNAFPVLLEFEFGSGFDSNGIPAIDIGNGIKLRGKIDRLELSLKEGFEDTNQSFMFTTVDYKSTKSGVSNDSKIRSGKSFQMPLYSIAIKKILKEYYNIEAELKGGIYYIIKTEGAKSIKDTSKAVLMTYEKSKDLIQKSNIMTNEDVQNMLQNSVEYANEIVRKISQSEFIVNPESASACTFCAYQPVCRINERSIIYEDSEIIEN